MNDPPKPKVTTLRLLLASLVLLAGTFAGLMVYAYRAPSTAPTLTLDKVYELGSQGRIRFAKLLDEDSLVVGQRCTGAPGGTEDAPPAPPVDPAAPAAPTGPAGPADPAAERTSCRPPLVAFQASYPRSDVATQQLIERMSAGGAEVFVDKQTPTAIIKLLLTFLFPLLMLANLFAIMLSGKGGGSAISDIAGFSRMGKGGKKGGKAKKGEEHRPSTGVTFKDVAGAEEAVIELTEITDYLKDPTRFQAYGATAPKGVLLFGLPGCGKTLLARAVAGEAGVPFFAVSGAEFVESLVGVGAARVRDLFRQVKEVAPAIVFIDEIDAVGRRRSGEGSTGGEREQTINQLLVELDGFEVNQGIVLMGATNRPDILDPALLRPGRFDRHVTLEPPAMPGRQAILQLHAAKKPMAEGIDFVALARRTAGFTGADLASVVNEAALLAIRQAPGTQIGMDQLNEAVLRVLHGPQRRGKIVNPAERRRLAFHEAAHGIVAASLGQSEAIQRVSIVARAGASLGSSVIANDEERVLFTTSDLEIRLAIAMAGAAAEQLVFGDRSTTSDDDLVKANNMAREMVGLHGMSTEVGPLRLLSTEEGFLGGGPRLVDAVSGNTLATFDQAVRALVDTASARAEKILTANAAHLETMAAALEELETLEGPALEVHLAKVARWGPPAANGAQPRLGAEATAR